MDDLDQATVAKALEINLDPTIYGTFAEIGAGQEVARHFFQAGKASQTIAKTISAYDMTFSDAIYGNAGRYVCEDRLRMMLDHEFELLLERLKQKRGSDSRFFALADTVATSSQDEPTARCHGWMGVRFQRRPGGPTNDIALHVRMLDSTRLQQQEALGILGVNLLHLAFFMPQSRGEIIDSLIDNLGPKRIEINVLRFNGEDFASVDNRLLSLQLVKSGVTEAVVFDHDGSLVNPSDLLFKKPIVVQRGKFRPVTKANVELMEKGLEQVRRMLKSNEQPQVFFEMTMNSFGGQVDLAEKDFLDRVDTLCSLGHKVLLSNFHLYYQLKNYLRHYTDQLIAVLVGASRLEKLFDESYYQGLPGGILEGFSRLFDEQTKLLVFPFHGPAGHLTAKAFCPKPHLAKLYQHFYDNKMILDLIDCESVDTAIHSETVRRMLESGDRNWENLVPSKVSSLIRERKLFGLGSSAK